MSDSEQNRSAQNSRSSTGINGFYVYCIAEAIPAEKIAAGSTPALIEEGADLELVTFQKLTAVVSRVPLSDFGEEPLAEHLTDAAWTAIRAMRHEQVVEHFAKQTSVVPLRFGTIYVDRSGVEKVLREKYAQLNGIIERLGGREEWGLNLYSDVSALLDNITRLSPRLSEMNEAAAKATPGQAYLMQKKIEALRVDESKVEVERAVREVEQRLTAASDGVERLRILKVETTEHGELKAKFAFLVERTKFEEFRNTAEELARQLEPWGLRIELTGPWPAYNFAGT